MKSGMFDSAAYGKAYDAHNEAWRKFDAVRIKYRAMEVGDAEFLAARAEFDRATKVYDEAYALAAYGGYMGPKA